jgi:sec-independent protein translocase protein TatB
MFGVSFSELMVILVVALIVVGPERLPKVARTLGMLWGRAQRYINGVKADLARDMAAEEIRQMRLKIQQEAEQLQRATLDTVNTLNQQARELQNAIVAEKPQDAAPEPKKLPPEQ